MRKELSGSNIDRVFLTNDINDFFLPGVKWGDSFFLSGYTIVHKKEEAQAIITKDLENGKLSLHKVGDVYEP